MVPVKLLDICEQPLRGGSCFVVASLEGLRWGFVKEVNDGVIEVRLFVQGVWEGVFFGLDHFRTHVRYVPYSEIPPSLKKLVKEARRFVL